MTSVRDPEIRQALREQLAVQHLGDPDTLIRHELGLCAGETRVDVAVLNGSIAGYEIKSPKDKLERLPKQVEIYGRVLDYATIVTSGKYTPRIKEHVPAWWGIVHAEERDGRVELEQLREPTRNSSVDALSLAQLLWREEALGELKLRGAARGLSSKARHYVWVRLVQELSLQELHDLVRRTLKQRPEWSGGQ